MSLGSLLEDTVATLIERLADMEYYPTPIIDLGVLIALADGTIDDEELSLLRELFGELLGTKLRSRLAVHLIDASRQVIDMAGQQSRIQFLGDILYDCDALEEGLIVAASIAYATKGVGTEERQVLEKLTQAAKGPSDLLDRVLVRVKTAPMPAASMSKLSLMQLPAADESGKDL